MGAIEIPPLVARKLERRTITTRSVRCLVNAGGPFPYFHDGRWKSGYYDPVENLFVGVDRDTVLTAFRPDRGSAYVLDLQANRPYYRE
jgi:hypothetical protein